MLRRLLLPYLAIVVCVCASGRALATPTPEPVLIKGHLAHPTRILARRAVPTSDGAHAAALAATGLRVVRTSALVPGWSVLESDQAGAATLQSTSSAAGASTAAASPLFGTLPPDEALLAQMEVLRASGLYVYVEPDYLISPDRVPSDSAFTDGTLWGLRNTGQGGGMAGADIGAESAWNVTTGSTGVIVAVIDSGIRLTHVDLAAQLWRNGREVPGNGRDDDNNGYVDDVHGIDAIANGGNPNDDDGHGTHVAGTIGAAANNGQAMVGVAWQVRIMACKFLPANGQGLTSDAIECVSYATGQGARILNCSWGSEGNSQSLRDALAAARAAGVLVVAAAGNEGTDNDRVPHYPSGYDLDNVISVAAFDRWGNLASFSNYGVRSVDLAAPGDSIFSTLNNSDTSYGTASGTSMAAPHVSGVAALLLAAEPTLSLADLRDRLLQTTVPSGNFAPYLATGGRLHAHRALTMAPDGQLELAITPPESTRLVASRDVVVTVRVTDLLGVKGATVTGTSSAGAALAFRDDGVAPDTVANDASYTATVAVPRGVAQLWLDVSAAAPGKSSASRRFTYTVEPPPANDLFADRTVLTGTSPSASQTNRGASREAGEPAHAGNTGGSSVWWTWTAPGAGTATITTEGSDFDTILGVYTGSELGALTEVASNDDISGPNQPSRVSISVTEGTTYQIAVDGFDGDVGNIYLRINATLAPTNDRFDRAVALTGSSVSVQGTTMNSTLEPGEPAHGGGGYNEVIGSTWWRWTAPADGIATVSSSSGSWPGANPIVYAGDRLTALARGPGRFGAVAGQTYMIAATRLSGSPGVDFMLSVNLVPGPANDLFARRIAVAGDTLTIQADITGASVEPGEPGLAGPGQGSTLWWSWTPATSGTARLLTTGSAGRPTIGVFTGDAVSALQLVTGDLDGIGDPDYAFLEWRVTGGNTYHIVADSYLQATLVRMAIEVRPPPANDDFVNRILISGTSVVVSGSNDGAGREPGEPDHLGGVQPPPRPAHATLWWAWTAPADGTAVFEGDGIVSVFTGNSIGALTPVIDADQIAYDFHRVVTRVTAGVQYQIARDGVGYVRGVLPLSVTWHASPPNDMFADRIALSGTSATLSGDAGWATFEPGETWPPYYYIKGTVWWTWTAPAQGTVLLTTTTDQVLAVYRGASVTGLTEVLGMQSLTPGQARVQFSASAGESYHFAVSPLGIGSTPVSIQLESVVPPANDMFAAPGTLTGASGAVTGSTRGATREVGEPSSEGDGRTIWWRWTTPSSGVAAVSASGSASSVALRVFEGSSLTGLTTLASGRYVSENQVDERARWLARAGATYLIAVDSYGGRFGPVSLNYSLTPVPANDTFAARPTLSGALFEVAADNFGATAENGEPATREGYSPHASLWWQWTAPARGTLELSLLPLGRPQEVAVFSGSTLATLARLPDSNSSSDGAIVHVEAGVTYQITVDTLWGVGSPFTLQGRLENPPANDMFADRIVVTGTDYSTSVDTRHATRELGESGHGNYYEAGSLWWSWTAPASGPALFTTRDATGPHDVEIATGSSPALLTRVAQGSGYVGRDVGIRINVSAGVTYHVIVDGPSASSPRLTLGVRQPQPVANDLFASRAVLTGASGHVEGSSLGAGIEAGEAYSLIGDYARASVWWTWTAPSTGTATFSLPIVEGQGWRRIVAFTGDSLGALVEQPNAIRPQSGLRFHAVAGTTYQIALLDVQGGSVGGPYSFDYAIEVPPANDMFAEAERIIGQSARVSGSTHLATRELGEFGSSVSPDGITNSLWWRWTAPRSGMLVLLLDPGAQTGSLLLATGTSVNSLSWVDSRGGYNPEVQRIRYPVVAGTDYVVRVDGPLAELDHFTLELDLLDPPANDSFAGRTAITGTDVTVVGDNRGASVENGEPYIGGYITDATLWWTWTAPVSGRTVIAAGESDIPTMLAAYTGSSISALTPVDSVFDSGGTGAALVFDAVAGTAYHLVVDGVGSRVGSVVVHVSMPAVPENDLFSRGTALAGESAVGHGSNLGAARESGEPQHAWHTRGCTLWWMWTAPRDGAVRLRTAGSSIDTLAAVYTGDAVNALQLVGYQARNELPAGERDVDFDFIVTGGTVYRIAIQGFSSNIGDIALSLEMYPRPLVRIDGSMPGQGAGFAGELRVNVVGDAVLAYQWRKDGVDIPGANGAALAFSSLQAFHAGVYTVRITTAHESITSDPMIVDVPAPPASDARVLNLSTRALCQTGENVLIPGFYISGAGTKRLLLRAVGPELTGFGVPGALADPQLVLRRAGETAILSSNDDWGTAGADQIRAAADSVYAFGLADGSKSAALLVDLPAGGYTIMASGKGDSTGVSIVELYEVAGGSESSRLINISNRGHVGVGGNIMIPGFVVSEEGPRTFLIRVVGPSLAPFGVQGVLLDPRLELYKRRPGTAIDDLILTNDTWGENGDAASIRQTATAVQAFGLLEASKDAAFVVTLPPGAYTVNAKGVGDTTGVALVEVYLVP